MDLLLLAQDAAPVAVQKLETIEDYLFWAIVGLCGVIASLAGFIATRIKAHAEEASKLEKAPDKVRAEERERWSGETKILLDKHTIERKEMLDRIKELSNEKDEIYQQSVELLERWFDRKRNGGTTT